MNTIAGSHLQDISCHAIFSHSRMHTIPPKFETRFSKLVKKYELLDHYDELRKDLRPGISIHPAKHSAKLGSSRFGGLPDTPPEFSWPISEFGYLHFVAQLRYNELPSFIDDLPRSGYMLFFASGDGTDCQVTWYLSVPRNLSPLSPPDRDEFSFSTADEPVFSPQPIRFEPAVYLPTIEAADCDDDDFWWQHYELKCDLGGSDSRLLGYSYYDPGHHGLDGGWDPLLQVDSFYPSSDMLWGDNGKLAFFVRRGCIKRRAFGRAASLTLGSG